PAKSSESAPMCDHLGRYNLATSMNLHLYWSKWLTQYERSPQPASIERARSQLMRMKMILPALTEAISPYFRPIKYSLFPPLGLATLAGYLNEDDQVTLQDEHVEQLDLNDEPELVVIQVYITSAYQAYKLADHYRARGAYV